MKFVCFSICTIDRKYINIIENKKFRKNKLKKIVFSLL